MLIEYFIKSTPAPTNHYHKQPEYTAPGYSGSELLEVGIGVRGWETYAEAKEHANRLNHWKESWLSHEVVRRAIIVSELEPVDE